MRWFSASQYWLGRLVLQRLLGLVYLSAFLNAAAQFRALLGENGLLPVPRFLERTTMRQVPSLFHLRYSDRIATAVSWAGVAVAAAVIAGLCDWLPLWASLLPWVVLWALYLSIVNVGQRFYSFGWESLLLEAGVLAVFLGDGHTAPPLPAIILVRWLVFRLEFGAGLIKMRGDRCWRDLTCLYYHHETQPMPNPLSWYFHHLPKPLHRAEVAANHVAQLVVPFFLFAPQPLASIAGIVIVVTQCWLILSGNFSWLNALTITLAFSAIDDSTLQRLLPLGRPALAEVPGWFEVVVVVVAAGIIVLSWRPARNLVSRQQVMNASFDRLHLVNTYGAFGSVTRVRDEVVLEGTLDERPGPGSQWREYEFKGKPGDPRRRPPQVAPYHLRLDWLMWFAAISPSYAAGWLPALVTKLLADDGRTLRLLRTNPFADQPPRWIRATLYRYRFTTPAEHRAAGEWWVREPIDDFMAPVSLNRRA
jgi:hypothetical protein